MTPEQFVVWLEGFFEGMNFSNQKLPLAPLLQEYLKKVNIDKVEYEIVSQPITGCHLGK